MRAGRAVRADGRRSALRRADRRAARALEPRRPGQDRSERRRPHPRPVRVPPGLSRSRAQPRLHLRALGPTPDPRTRAGRLRARRHRSRPSGAARASVLALLRVQRLEQPPRGRLGDDPAQLRSRRRARGTDARPDVGRLQPARRCRASRLGRRQARARRRPPPGRVPGSGIARELLRGGAFPRQLGRPGRGLRRHDRSVVRAEACRTDDPERPVRRSRGVPVDRLRGALGGAAGGVLQRPDRPQSQESVDRAHRVVGGLA